MTKALRISLLGAATCMASLLLGMIFGLLLGMMPISDGAPTQLFLIAVGAFLIATVSAHFPRRFSTPFTVFPVHARLPTFLFLTSIPLATSITSVPRSPRGLMLWDRVGGFLPFSDAHGYYQQVLSAPSDDFDDFNSRRPLNAMIRILEFDLGGSSLLGIQVIQIALAAIAVSILGTAVAARVGMLAATGVVSLALYWIWPYASSLLTEINGFTMAAASMGLLLFAVTHNSLKLFLGGIFGLVIAYLLRPYSPLMPALFAVLMSYGISWRTRKSQALSVIGVAASSVGLVVILPILLSSLYSDPEARTPNGNTSVVLLGIARGTNWAEADFFVRSISPTASERELVQITRTQALNHFVHDPSIAVQSLARNSTKGVAVLINGFGGGYIQASCLRETSTRQLLGCALGHIGFWLVLSLCIMSTWALLFLLRRRDPLGLLFASSALAYITFAPIAVGDGGWRAAASLYPGLATLLALAPAAVLLRRSERFPTVTTSKSQPKSLEAGTAAPIALAAGLIAFTLLAVPYPGARQSFKDPSVKPQSFILEIGRDSPGRWTSTNSGVVSLPTLLEWAEVHGYLGLKAYLESSGQEIESITFDEVFRIWPRTESGRMPEAPVEPLFQLESRLRPS